MVRLLYCVTAYIYIEIFVYTGQISTAVDAIVEDFKLDPLMLYLYDMRVRQTLCVYVLSLDAQVFSRTIERLCSNEPSSERASTGCGIAMSRTD